MLWLVLGLGLSACSRQSLLQGSAVRLMQAVGHCRYDTVNRQLPTLESLQDIKGALGRVVTSPQNVETRAEILDHATGFATVDTDFSESGGVLVPMDYNTLFAVSLYAEVETAHLTFAGLDPAADMTRLLPGFGSRTFIVHEARRTLGGEVGKAPETTDNAEFLGHFPSDGGPTINYLFSFPTREVSGMPLGLNLGIMAHEYTHLIFHHLFHVPFKDQHLEHATNSSFVTLSAFEEGLADYFGYLASKDPGYFDCSFPGSGRDVSQPKHFTAEIVSRLQSDPDADIHEAGAVWAAIAYQIGQASSHEENGRALIKMMPALLQCLRSGTAIRADFAKIAACHQQVAGSAAATVQRVYSQYMGAAAGGIR